MTAGVRALRRAGPRCRSFLALSLLLLFALAGRARAQAAPAGYEQGIFELRVARIATETVPGLLAPDGTVLVPIDRVIALTGMPVQRTDSTITVELARNAGSATLAITARELRDKAGAHKLRAEELLRVDGVVYLATARVADLLGARVDSDLGQLAISITRSPPFPVEQAAARAQRTSGGATSASTRAIGDGVPFTARSGGGVVDWNLSSVGSVKALSGATGTVRAAAAIAGGDLSGGVGLSTDGSGTTRTTTSQWSYRRGFPESRVVREMQVGDIVGGGALFRSLRGFTLTNAHPLSDPFFGSVPVNVSLPQGWQYEVYQDGQLIGFSDAGVAAPVYVPLRYGSTPVQVRLVSPTGDESVRDFSYLIPQSQQQPGRFEYSAGGGRCASGCDALLFADGSYGLRPWLTLTAGAEQRTMDGVSGLYPEAGASVVTYAGWNAQVQAARQSFERASVLYSGTGALTGAASYSHTYTGTGQPSVIADVNGSRWLMSSVMQLRSPTLRYMTGLRFDNTLEGVGTLQTERSRTALGADFTRGMLSVSYEADRTRALHELGLSTLLVFAPQARISSMLATLSFDQHSLHALEVSTSHQIGTRGGAALTARIQQGSGATVTLGYNGALGALRLTSRMSASSRQPAYLAATASGSAALDGGRTPALFQGPGVGLAGVNGRVFYDNDGDNKYGPGDLPAVGVRVVVSGVQTRTDSLGRYHVWSVAPYEATDVALDTLAFNDPSWTVLRGRSVVRPSPGTFNDVDFPLVRTRELAGQLLGDSTIATTAGVTLLLTPAQGGAAQKIVTFSDGSFYLSRVRPGRYELTVSAGALDVLHAEASPAIQTLQVIVSADEPVLNAVPIRLHGRPPSR